MNDPMPGDVVVERKTGREWVVASVNARTVQLCGSEPATRYATAETLWQRYEPAPQPRAVTGSLDIAETDAVR